SASSFSSILPKPNSLAAFAACAGSSFIWPSSPAVRKTGDCLGSIFLQISFQLQPFMRFTSRTFSVTSLRFTFSSVVWRVDRSAGRGGEGARPRRWRGRRADDGGGCGACLFRPGIDMRRPARVPARRRGEILRAAHQEIEQVIADRVVVRLLVQRFAGAL